jgi:hypothetical protein
MVALELAMAVDPVAQSAVLSMHAVLPILSL